MPNYAYAQQQVSYYKQTIGPSLLNICLQLWIIVEKLDTSI